MTLSKPNDVEEEVSPFESSENEQEPEESEEFEVIVDSPLLDGEQPIEEVIPNHGARISITDERVRDLEARLDLQARRIEELRDAVDEMANAMSGGGVVWEEFEG